MTPNEIRTYLGMAAGAAAFAVGIASGDAATIALGAALLGVGPTTNAVINGNGKKKAKEEAADEEA